MIRDPRIDPEYLRIMQQMNDLSFQPRPVYSPPPVPGDPNFRGPMSPQQTSPQTSIEPVEVTAQRRQPGFFPSRIGRSMARGGGFDMTDAQKRGVYTPAEQAQFRADRNQGIGKMLLGLSDAFAGRPIAENFMAREEYAKQQELRDKKLAEQQRIREMIMSDETLSESQKEIFAALPEVYADYITRTPPKPDLQRLGVYDTSGNQVGTVLRSNVQGIADLEQGGYLIGNMSSPTTTPQSDNNDAFDVIYNKVNATGQLINATNNLAQQMYDNPQSALRVGTTTQFIDGIIKNVDEGLNLLGRKEESENWKEYASKGISQEGSDFSNRINEVSRETGVTESQIRDLAYLFAAARGQEGRGLSDKDYENALAIVSGGVGAENRVAVLENVAGRLRSQALYDLNFSKQFHSNNPEMMNKLNQIPGLPTFTNPFNVPVQQGSSSVTAQSDDDPLGIRRFP